MNLLLCWYLWDLILWSIQADSWWWKWILLLTGNPCNNSFIALVARSRQNRDNFSDFKSDSILLRFLPIHFIDELVPREISCPFLIRLDLFLGEFYWSIFSDFHRFLVRSSRLRSLRVCALSLLLLLLRVSKLSETLICSLSCVSLSAFFEFLQGILNAFSSKDKKEFISF